VKVPLLDLRAQYATIKEEVLAATREVYESQQFILGPKVKSSKRWSPRIAGVPMRSASLQERMRCSSP